ncbi:aldehyde dehydrogenase family protein [Exilibacterium tricleocarpae]|uniref:aldehyde dehydrogenase (NAD(+)) n=1 Tax=Exilibacterium tricleocarpae TaxID=2591008 RepID=A0A545U3K9_9GAMM|nr:aldehyde dehydrogenase family protein [Exilibacterium tricleocarpae]TQV83993.1 aldehyde dehydrogenase family protein [Exilibacterium tricleocarpae]
MKQCQQFYIDGVWVDPMSPNPLEVINPATEQPVATISLGSSYDVDAAVDAARDAFEHYSQTSREERIALLERILAIYQERIGEMAAAISAEMGAPMAFATHAQAPCGTGHIATALEVLKTYPFEEDLGGTHIFKEPVGVCGLITPWNWPINQIACKVAPALATGCTMVLKPSEVAPLSAYLFAEILDAAGVPAGVFNLVNGDGPTVGHALSQHPGIDMMSFTGSTRAGIQVAKAAADTVKRVAQELGGKSANIILDDANLEKAVSRGVMSCFGNTGQSCNAPTRMLVPASLHDEAVAIAKKAAAAAIPGDPQDPATTMGPVVSEAQYKKIQGLLHRAVEEGCELVTGGPGKPEGLGTGYFVKPTIFANVSNDKTIAREEVFGPVLAIIPYSTEAEAVQIANDTPYGLSGYVSAGDIARARRVAARLRTGMVHLNGAATDIRAPFGGYKQSGNGREWGAHGFEDFLEIKAVMGYDKA